MVGDSTSDIECAINHGGADCVVLLDTSRGEVGERIEKYLRVNNSKNRCVSAVSELTGLERYVF